MKVILHYEDKDGYDMLIRCFDNYKDSKNAGEFGTNSITIYSNDLRTAYFKKNKSGSITGKSWLTAK